MPPKIIGDNKSKKKYDLVAFKRPSKAPVLKLPNAVTL